MRRVVWGERNGGAGVRLRATPFGWRGQLAPPRPGDRIARSIDAHRVLLLSGPFEFLESERRRLQRVSGREIAMATWGRRESHAVLVPRRAFTVDAPPEERWVPAPIALARLARAVGGARIDLVYWSTGCVRRCVPVRNGRPEVGEKPRVALVIGEIDAAGSEWLDRLEVSEVTSLPPTLTAAGWLAVGCALAWGAAGTFPVRPRSPVRRRCAIAGATAILALVLTESVRLEMSAVESERRVLEWQRRLEMLIATAPTRGRTR